jgi:hypothetical protein
MVEFVVAESAVAERDRTAQPVFHVELRPRFGSLACRRAG